MMFSLRMMFPSTEGVVFVDNERTFRRALDEHAYDEVFWDNCYGDFGHGTRLGNRMLAENVADAIVKYWSDMDLCANPRADAGRRPAGAGGDQSGG